MGTGFSIDTPAKVAHYGISSVIPLADDILIEKMREYYSAKLDIPFEEISDKLDDFRAKRITAYLNLIDKVVKEKFEALKQAALDKGSEFKKYLEMLPDYSWLKLEYYRLINNGDVEELKRWISTYLVPGSVDVNIMTKLDKTNYNGQKDALPYQYNDAHAALRGYATSNLESSIVFSAGMNPRLFGYMENFHVFYPDKQGNFKKKIVLKVSDYRSALIQGKFLAKKGLWVSEYRIESGLNCGGHAFATEGHLLGPVLEEFKANKNTLIDTTFELLKAALEEKGQPCPPQLPLYITAQGGVGTTDEHNLLLDHFELDSIGWGTPFLLVPEAINVDHKTQGLLKKAKEQDQYLSNTSPLGIPYNTLRGNTQDLEKERLQDKGRPGSACPKKFLISNSEYTTKPICTASREYQNAKLKELAVQDLSHEELEKQQHKIIEKSCICMGLANGVLQIHHLQGKKDGPGVSVCPGPNIAYFDKTVSLQTMVDHIYGRTNVMERSDRPNMFIKEFKLYLDYYLNKLTEATTPISIKQQKYFNSFRENLQTGLQYYKDLFSKMDEDWKTNALKELRQLENQLNQLISHNSYLVPH